MKKNRMPAIVSACAVVLFSAACGGNHNNPKPDISISAESSSVLEDSAGGSETEFEITNSPSTGVSHKLGDESCDATQFKAGDTVSGTIYNGYDAFATYSDKKTFGGNDAGISLYRMKFFPVVTGGKYVVYASNNVLDYGAFPDMEKAWDTYDRREAAGASESELAGLKPEGISVTGRIEPMPEEIRKRFIKWIESSFVDASGETIQEYCLTDVYIIHDTE